VNPFVVKEKVKRLRARYRVAVHGGAPDAERLAAWRALSQFVDDVNRRRGG
jgi:hypothetical protein